MLPVVIEVSLSVFSLVLNSYEVVHYGGNFDVVHTAYVVFPVAKDLLHLPRLPVFRYSDVLGSPFLILLSQELAFA